MGLACLCHPNFFWYFLWNPFINLLVICIAWNSGVSHCLLTSGGHSVVIRGQTFEESKEFELILHSSILAAGNRRISWCGLVLFLSLVRKACIWTPSLINIRKLALQSCIPQGGGEKIAPTATKKFGCWCNSFSPPPYSSLLECSSGSQVCLQHQAWTPISSLRDSEFLFASRQTYTIIQKAKIMNFTDKPV